MPAENPTVDSSTRQRLRRVALELFAQRGYSGASMAEMASRVGVTKATLYNYYPSKEALLLDLLEASFNAWRDASRAPLERPGPLAERLYEHLRAAVEFGADHPSEVAVIRVATSQIGGELGHQVREWLQRQTVDYITRLEALLAAGIAAGEIVEAEPPDLARAWRAFLDGLLIDQLFAVGDPRAALRRLPQLWQIFWSGLGKEAST